MQDHFARGDWPTGVREGLTELAKEFGEFGKDYGKEFGKDFGFGRGGAEKPAARPEYAQTPQDFPAEYEPAWAHEGPGWARWGALGDHEGKPRTMARGDGHA